MNNDKVFEILLKKLGTTTKTGKISETRARNAYFFYSALQRDGFQKVKEIVPTRTFQMNVKALVDAGFSRSYLQNLTKDNKELPILRILNLDANLSAPNPSWYQSPATQYFDEFKCYFPTQQVA